MSSPTLSQKLTAEAIGTAILVFIGAGSVPLTVFLTGSNPFGSAELSTISFTIALLATRKIDSSTAIGYIGAQLVGALIGAGLTLIILTGNDPVALGLGAVDVNANAGIGIGFAAEVIGTAILVFTVFGAAVDGRAPAGFAGIIIGFIVYGIIILVGPITGAALNPARQIGPEVLELIIGSKTNLGALLPVYVAGPIVGGLVGAFTYQFIGHTRTATVPGAAVAEHAHEAA
jgi:glycerol uptake facilitator protein